MTKNTKVKLAQKDFKEQAINYFFSFYFPFLLPSQEKAFPVKAKFVSEIGSALFNALNASLLRRTPSVFVKFHLFEAYVFLCIICI